MCLSVFAILPFVTPCCSPAQPRSVAMPMSAAAEHLTPVTLDFGGKSPAIVGPRFTRIVKPAQKILFSKCVNAGQTSSRRLRAGAACAKGDAFADAAQRAVEAMYPSLADNADTLIVNARHRARLLGYLDDAPVKARPCACSTAKKAWPPPEKSRPPGVVANVNDTMCIMQDRRSSARCCPWFPMTRWTMQSATSMPAPPWRSITSAISGPYRQGAPTTPVARRRDGQRNHPAHFAGTSSVRRRGAVGHGIRITAAPDSETFSKDETGLPSVAGQWNVPVQARRLGSGLIR